MPLPDPAVRDFAGIQRNFDAIQKAIADPSPTNDLVRMGQQPAGTIATTIVNRSEIGIGSAVVTPTQNQLLVAAGDHLGMYIPAGKVITNLNVTAITAGASLTNSWMCLIRQSDLVPVATTQDRLTATFSTTLETAFRIASTLGGSTTGTWTCPATAFYMVGIVVAGVTMPSFVSANSNARTGALAPPVAGLSSTGRTTPASLPSPIGAISGFGSILYCRAT